MHDSEHPFYARPAIEQARIQSRIGWAAFAINLVIAVVFGWLGWYLIPILCVAATLSIVAPFFDTPSLKKKGKLIYYSPLFVAEAEQDGLIKMHGGTLFDYVFVIDRTLSGRQRLNQIMLGYIDGVLNLIDTHADSDLEQIRLRGTSYIINERTAQRIGLKEQPTDFLQLIILGYNYLNLTVSYSIARGRVSFPRLGKISTFEGSLAEINQHRPYLKNLQRRLRSGLRRNRD